MQLPPLVQTFVLHFGEMGSRWGINRTVGQIYALLFVAERPFNADEIVERLGVSRSNVSMGLKELQAWNLVRLQHRPGDRRDYFTTPEDIWQIVRTLVEERKKREVDPTLTLLRELLMQDAATEEERHAQERLKEMHDLFELFAGWYADVRRLETERLVQLLTLGAKVQKVLEMKDRLTRLPGRIGGRAPKPDLVGRMHRGARLRQVRSSPGESTPVEGDEGSADMLDMAAQAGRGLLKPARLAQVEDLRMFAEGAGRVVGGRDLQPRRPFAILQQSGHDRQRPRAIGVAEQVEMETAVQVAPSEDLARLQRRAVLLRERVEIPDLVVRQVRGR